MSEKISLKDKRRALVMAYRIATEKRNANRYGSKSITGIDDTTLFTYSDMLRVLKAMLHELAGVTQKPLTLQELHALIDAGPETVTWAESKDDPEIFASIFYNGRSIDRFGNNLDTSDLHFPSYGKRWRVWASRPTDEERAVAPWEDAGDADL